MKLAEVKDVDTMWLMVKSNLDPDILSDPKMRRLAHIFSRSMLTYDRENPIKSLLRISKGSRSKALELSKDIMTKHYGVDESEAKDIEHVFDHVIAAATGGTEYEWDSE
jgi:hypothetical protein